MHSVLLIEDEPALRADLVEYLSAKGYRVSEAGTAAEAKACLDAHPIDAVILDIELPDSDGYQLLEDLRVHRQLECGVVILTAAADPDLRVRGLELGADAYLVKRASLREIAATLQSVLRRVTATAPSIGPTVATPTWSINRTTWALTSPGGSQVRLTGMEFAFLSILAAQVGSACSRRDIVQAVGRPSQSDDRNIDAMVSRLRRKIETSTGIEAPIRVVYGAGYALTASLRES